MMKNKWLYKKVSDDHSPRFVLGEQGKRPLVCFGVNPSTAVPEKLDATLTRVRNISKEHKFDGWIMLNLYPERATKFDELTKKMNDQMHRKNIYWIKKIFLDNPDSQIWAAWGGLIEKRWFLKECLKDIVKNVPPSVKWLRRGSLVGRKHPHHPLYLKNDSTFERFDIHRYLTALEGE